MWARPYFQVLESGETRMGSWVPATVDLMAAYEATFGGAPKGRTEGIALLSDANSTNSLAAASYGEVRAWRRGTVSEELLQRQCDCYSD